MNQRPIVCTTIALTSELETCSHLDVRTSVASLPFGRRNTTRLMSFTYRLLDRLHGRWLLARTPELCTGALACKARTVLHYPLPLTVDDVVSRRAPPRVLLRARIPDLSRCVNLATSAHRLAAIPASFPTRTREPGLPGLTAPEGVAEHHGSCPFFAVTDD